MTHPNHDNPTPNAGPGAKPRDTNRVVLRGEIAETPQSRSKPQGDRSVALRVATVDRVNRGGQWVEYKSWHRVVCFGPAAELAGWLRKGERVYLEGRLQTRKYGDETKPQYITEVVVSDIEKLASDREVDASGPTPGHDAEDEDWNERPY